MMKRILKDHRADVIPSLNRPKILMIDEVDVFFSKEFFGQAYVPLAEIRHPAVSQMLDFIWEEKSKGTKVTYNLIKKSQ